jgi:hypothetical protein
MTELVGYSRHAINMAFADSVAEFKPPSKDLQFVIFPVYTRHNPAKKKCSVDLQH